MMDAFYLELLPQMLERATTVFENIVAYSDEFEQAVMRAGYEIPLVASSGMADSRFRLFLKVPGRQELTGVYYVSGWGDKGTVNLSWDDEEQGHILIRRREAIMATRAKNRAEEVIL
jgi:hypothetical protein